MNVVLFEDHLVDQLFPVTLTRPAYAMTCGSMRLVDLANSLSPNLFGVVRSYLTGFQAEYLGMPTFDRTASTLWINARAVPDAELFTHIKSELGGGPFCVKHKGQISLALTSPGYELNSALAKRSVVFAYLAGRNLPEKQLNVPLVDYPHQLIEHHGPTMLHNLVFRIANEGYTEVAENVFGHEGLELPSNVVFDTSRGPIVIDRGVKFGPFAVVKGPVYIGPSVKVAPHSQLTGPLAIGEFAKVGGEVSGSIIEPFSNKVHYGYLGSSYVGSWVNLGAGTTNSNLKNTYGAVKVEYGGRKVDTGMQFFGCVIGDYTKTAINTSIYTGKILGACSNVYGDVTANVPSFANYAKSFGDVTEHSVDVMEVAQQRMFDRRGIFQEERHCRLLRSIYEIETKNRKLVNKPPSL